VSPAPTPTTATSSSARHASQRIDTTDGADAPAVLPYHSTFAWCRSSGISHSRRTASSMRRFAWWPTKWKRRAGSAYASRRPARPSIVFLIANICTARPCWRKCPVRGTTTLSAPAGLDDSVLPWISARPGTRVDSTAAAVPSPQRTAEARSS
jgi:hypothetical protein